MARPSARCPRPLSMTDPVLPCAQLLRPRRCHTTATKAPRQARLEQYSADRCRDNIKRQSPRHEKARDGVRPGTHKSSLLQPDRGNSGHNQRVNLVVSVYQACFVLRKSKMMVFALYLTISMPNQSSLLNRISRAQFSERYICSSLRPKFLR